MASISSQGLIYTWGSGFYGRLGHNDQENRYVPKQITSVTSVFKEISCGTFHTIAIEESGYLFIWGRGKQTCSYTDVLQPTKINELKNRTFKQVAAGDGHTIALSQDGEVFVWGSNKYGKLGLDIQNEQYQVQPLKVMNIPSDLVFIASGYNHCVAITQIGDVFTWGCGGSGRLGHNSVKSYQKPNRIMANWTATKGQEDGEQDEAENTVFDYLHNIIMRGGTLSTFKDMMVLLSMEDDDSQVYRLQYKEKDILFKLNKIENYIKDLKGNDELIKKFQNEIQKVILQRSYQLKIQNAFLSETKLEAIISSQIMKHEEIIWVLQTQPCYLSRLINYIFKNKPSELERVIQCVNQMFQNINMSSDGVESRERSLIAKRDQLLFLNLCKRIIKEEVDDADNFNDLFGASTQSTLFLRTFFSREMGSTISEKLLLEPLKIIENETKGSDMFSIDPFAIAKKENIDPGNRTSEVLINDKKISYIVSKNGTQLIKYARKIIESIEFNSAFIPLPFKYAIKFAKKRIESRFWRENPSLEYNFSKEFQEKILMKLMALLYKNLLFPIVRSPEAENLLTNVDDILRTNLYNLAAYLDKICERGIQLGGEILRDLNGFIRQYWENLSNIIKSFTNTDDKSKIELSLISYEAHFVIELPNINLRYQKIIIHSKLIQKLM